MQRILRRPLKNNLGITHDDLKSLDEDQLAALRLDVLHELDEWHNLEDDIYGVLRELQLVKYPELCVVRVPDKVIKRRETKALTNEQKIVVRLVAAINRKGVDVNKLLCG